MQNKQTDSSSSSSLLHGRVTVVGSYSVQFLISLYICEKAQHGQNVTVKQSSQTEP